MRSKLNTPEAIVLAVLLAFVAAGIAFGSAHGGSSSPNRSSSDPAAGARAAAGRVASIARRIEPIRGLRFRALPKPLIVSPAQTRRDSLAELDRSGSERERRDAASVLELLGLVEPGTDLRAVAGDISGEQVAGYYDTRRKRLAIVAGPAASAGATSEITLAHELDHALEDQALGIEDQPSSGADDGTSAYTALVEGSATAVMDDYTRRFVDPSAALGSAFSALGSSGQASAKIPPYLMSSLLFSYLIGERFVNRLRQIAHGWKLVDYALRRRPPASTEQVIHPEKYLTDERPVRVRLTDVRGLVPAGWRRAARGTIGEFDTDQLLKLGVGDGPAGDAAAGWGGGRYELWTPRRATPASACPSPCRRSSVLVVSWVWDTAVDAAQFGAAVRRYVTAGLSGRRASGRGGWNVGDGGAAVSAQGLRTTLAFAPSVERARRIASGAAPAR